MIRNLLIANRGEIARRIIRTARTMGVATVAVHSDVDAGALFVREADRAVSLGGAAPKDSYLRQDALIEAAKATGADAVHPGYGFLAENAAFAEKVIAAGLVWVGPPPAAIRAMGLKDQAKRLMEKAGVPIAPGYHGEDQDPKLLAEEAARIGYPVLIKASAGGGGKGMRRVDDKTGFMAALAAAKREASGAFGDDRVLVEKYILSPRHVEVQVFADAHGNVVHLYERDCSLQRRHQKVIEEAPAPGMTHETRAAMTGAAVKAAEAVGYVGAGTVEFIADGSQGLKPDGFFFMEMNTRLQVEHPVTEAVTGLDLVALQLRAAAGAPLGFTQADIALKGHAVEARLYAEDPAAGFLPSTGRLERLRWGAPPAAIGAFETSGRSEIRVDAAVEEGDEVSPHYDPMIAKVIAHRATREEAFAALALTLKDTQVRGPRTNLGFLARLLGDAEVREGAVRTGLIAERGDALVAPPARDAQAHALAFAAYAESLAEAGARSPWDAGDAWRVGAAARLDLVFEGEDGPVALIGERRGDGAWMVHVDNKTIEVVARIQDDRLRGAVGGAPIACGVEVGPWSVALHQDGFVVEFKLHDALAAAEAAAGGGDGAVLAPMPGKIIKLHAGAGDAVKAGQPLLTLEAMKMEHTLTAAFDGVVEAVHAGEGDQVEMGALLAAVTVEGAGS